MQIIVGGLLRIGVLLAGGVVLAGAIWYLSTQGSAAVPFGKFHAQKGVMPWTGSLALIQVGLLILIATPVARVVLLLVAFTLEKDKVYVGITMVVLAILAFSLLGY